MSARPATGNQQEVARAAAREPRKETKSKATNKTSKKYRTPGQKDCKITQVTGNDRRKHTDLNTRKED